MTASERVRGTKVLLAGAVLLLALGGSRVPLRTAPEVVERFDTRPCATWRPGPAIYNYYLNAVDAISDRDVWAAGGEQAGPHNEARPFAENWNGHRWKVADLPFTDAISGGGPGISAIAAPGADDVWMVGNYATGSFAYHWNGHRWTIATVGPAGASRHPVISAVSALAPNDVWAAGGLYSPTSATRSRVSQVVYRWNGKKWLGVEPESSVGLLTAVAAVQPSLVWVGGEARIDHSAVELWDGGTWRATPPPSKRMSSLVVGLVARPGTKPWVLLSGGALVRWAGTGWRPVASAPGNGFVPTSISLASSREVIEVGYVNAAHSDTSAAAVEVWRNSRWSRASVDPPKKGRSTYLSGVSTAGGQAYAVGGDDSGSSSWAFVESSMDC
jgi:hypothetical protein